MIQHSEQNVNLNQCPLIIKEKNSRIDWDFNQGF